MAEKTFTVAGISTNADGIKTYRFSNGAINLRRNMLTHNGHTDINLVELPRAMDQVHAIAWLLNNMRGTRGAVIATRAADKSVKSDVIVEAEQLAAKSKARAGSTKAAPKKADGTGTGRGRGRPRNDENREAA